MQGLPWLLVGAGLGIIVDRADRRRLMIIVDITRAVIIAALAAAVLAHGAGLVLIYLTAFTAAAHPAQRLPARGRRASTPGPGVVAGGAAP